MDDESKLFGQIPDEAPDLMKQVHAKDVSKTVREAIAKLTPEQQEIILLKFMGYLSNKEIAEITGKSEEAIRQMQFRAVRALKKHITDDIL